MLSVPAMPRIYKSGSLLDQNDLGDAFCYLILSGIVGRTEDLAKGQRAITSLFLRGQIVGLPFAGSAPARYETCSPVELSLVPCALLARIVCGSPTLARTFLQMERHTSDLLSKRLAIVSRLAAKPRLAYFLCEMATRNERAGSGTRDGFPLPLNQTQMGEILGMTAVHINRVLQSLRREQLVDVRSGRASILDWKMLAALGSFAAP